MTIAFGSAGTLPTPAATTVAVPYPAGIVAGDLLLLAAVNKYSAYTSAPPTGFTFLHERIGGSGGTGADVGNVRTAVWYRIADGTETGTVNVTKATETGSVIMPRMFRYTRSAGYGWSLIAESGTSSSGSTAWSASGGNSNYIESGDLVIVVTGVNTDAASFASHGFAATGCTFGAATERQDSGTTAGHDVRLVVTEHPCTAGSTTSPSTYTATGSTSTPDGSSIFIRLRESLGVVAAQGGYTLGGQDVSPLVGYKITAAQGTYGLTGYSATFSVGLPSLRSWAENAWAADAWYGTAWYSTEPATYSMPAAQGSYALSGQSASFKRGLLFAADQGSYALSGQDTGLLKGYKLTAAGGSYALSGQDIGFSRTYQIAADQGSYALTGQSILMYLGGEIGKAWADDAWYTGAWYGTVWAGNTGAPGAYSINAETGYYQARQTTTVNAWFQNSWYENAWGDTAWNSGQIDTGLRKGYVLTAETGYYTYTGDDALRDFLFHSDQGGYTLSGQDASFLSGLFITADQGSYALTGQSAGLLKGYRLDAQFGNYATQGYDAEFIVGVGLTANTGSYALTGQSVTFSVGRGIQAETGTYALNGQDVGLVEGGIMPAATGTYALNGQDVTFARTRVLRAETGYYRLGGQIGTPEVIPPVEEPRAGGPRWGGFDIGKKRRKKKYYEELPTPEDVIEEQIRLQALPKKVQKAVNKVIEKASGVQTKEQATNLAAAYFEEEQQRRLFEMLRKEIAASKSKWQDEVFTVAHAMILDELQKKSDRDELGKIIAERQAEESEINDILELWLNL